MGVKYEEKDDVLGLSPFEVAGSNGRIRAVGVGWGGGGRESLCH